MKVSNNQQWVTDKTNRGQRERRMMMMMSCRRKGLEGAERRNRRILRDFRERISNLSIPVIPLGKTWVSRCLAQPRYLSFSFSFSFYPHL